ncbi:MAG TPA: GNAT family N-acetyltransferase [Longimicrobiales bacterium]|nr:GNAT family N-acetyltransferase [Longimicrobiales bacterium]
MHVAIAFDALALRAEAPADVRGVLSAVEAVELALAELGHASVRVPVQRPAGPALEVVADPVDLVFNLCESIDGDGAGEAHWVAALELLGRPVTGASSELIALARRKDHVGAILAAAGVATPDSRTVPDAARLADWIEFPAIVKPAAADGSAWITQRSVARDREELRRVVDESTGAPGGVLVQPLLTGRELTVAFVGPAVLPVAEIEYVDVPEGYWPIVDYAAKWRSGSVEDRMTVPRCPARIPRGLERQAVALARAAWEAVSGTGCGRVDLRADAAGRLHVLEVNPNPDLDPGAGLARMAAAHGWSYTDLVGRLLDDALQRAGRPGTHAPIRSGARRGPAGARQRAAAAVTIAELQPEQRNAVAGILRATDMFRADEIEIALEVIDATFANPGQDYTALGAFTQDGELVGYTCHGPTPCTLGTYDLYWIAVHPATQGSGVGSALLQEVERRLAMAAARLLLIETSSQPRYEPTRGFYERHGYREVARVPDFYAVGDDRVIFARRFHPSITG